MEIIHLLKHVKVCPIDFISFDPPKNTTAITSKKSFPKMTLQVPTTLVTLTSILPLSCSVDVPFINGKYSKDDSIRHYTFQNITPSSIHSDSSRHSPSFLLSLMQSQTRSSQSTQYTINVSSSFFQQTHHILHSLNSVSLLEGRYTTNWPLLKEPGLTT